MLSLSRGARMTKTCCRPFSFVFFWVGTTWFGQRSSYKDTRSRHGHTLSPVPSRHHVSRIACATTGANKTKFGTIGPDVNHLPKSSTE